MLLVNYAAPDGSKSTTVSGTAAPPTLFERWEEPFTKPRYIIFVSASLSDSPPSIIALLSELLSIFQFDFMFLG